MRACGLVSVSFGISGERTLPCTITGSGAGDKDVDEGTILIKSRFEVLIPLCDTRCVSTQHQRSV